MTATAPKSREEWRGLIIESMWSVSGNGWDSMLDSIMALQSEVEGLRLRENELICAVDIGVQQLQQIQNCEGMLQDDVDIIEKMKKARQPK